MGLGDEVLRDSVGACVNGYAALVRFVESGGDDGNAEFVWELWVGGIGRILVLVYVVDVSVLECWEAGFVRGEVLCDLLLGDVVWKPDGECERVLRLVYVGEAEVVVWREGIEGIVEDGGDWVFVCFAGSMG